MSSADYAQLLKTLCLAASVRALSARTNAAAVASSNASVIPMTLNNSHRLLLLNNPRETSGSE